MTASHSSSSMRISRLSRVMPALLTRMSIAPNAPIAALTISSHDSRPAEVSPWIASPLRPEPRMPATVSSAAAWSPR